MNRIKLDNEVNSEYSMCEQDTISNFILDQYHGSLMCGLKSTGDGDCLLNAVSTCLAGDESRSVELKYRCCIEMIANIHKIVNHRLFAGLELISPDYDKDCVDCSKPY